jgi:methionine-rich copper-binding protein CopC
VLTPAATSALAAALVTRHATGGELRHRHFGAVRDDYLSMANLTARPVAARRAVAGVLASSAALVVFGVSAAPAWAHAQLLRTTPAANGTATEPVTAVTLTFNEPVKQQSTAVTVAVGDGSSYSDGAARVVDSTVTQPVRPLPVGAVRVTWKTVSADGDPIQGEFSFTVAPTAAPATTAPAPASPSPSPAQPTGPAAVAASSTAASQQPAGSSMPWVLGLGGAALLVALGAVALVRRRRSAAG